jgi:integrase
LTLIGEAETSRQPAMADFYRVAALTGMRRGELCGLRWSDIDWGRGMITVRRSIYQIAGNIGEKNTKSGRSKRIFLGDAGLHLFTRLHKSAETEAREARVRLQPDGFVFSGSEGGTTPWTPNGVTQFTTRLRDRLDIPDFHLHSLRHWSGTALVEAGIDIRNIAGRLGHSDGGVLLLNRYAHRSDEQDRKAGEVLGTLLGMTDDPGTI